MKIVFITNFINHHQVHVADEFAKTQGIEYYFVETEAMPKSFKSSGYPDYSNRPYVIKTYENDERLSYARALIDNADVVIIGSAPESFVHRRLQENKITFHYSERWFKTGYHSLLSPRAWLSWYKKHIRYRNKRSYMLCASAYTAPDVHKVFAYPNKCFKWGYFTQVPELDIEKILEAQKGASRIRILYISRFLSWKHPELPVQLARLLKDAGIDFELNMYGNGPEFSRITALIDSLKVNDCVNLCGNRPNDEILEIMREHHIFLFTSDRNEGWGAVVGESMSNGCAVIASEAIGSVPFLIQGGVNGLTFKDQSLSDLFNKTMLLIKNQDKRAQIVRNAYKTMHDVWSPKNAAQSFVELAKSAMANDIHARTEGPCSYC